MALKKKVDSFDQQDTNFAELAKALSHPARIVILRMLADRNRCICGDFVDILPLAQSTVSQHLQELKKAGLIVGEIEGPKSCYSINMRKLGELNEWFQTFLKDLKCC
ncbi:ArsR/SmtB family transcription factor [candidate division CSSED10-310 bacterium]|uniref:ArsR/SmtB family transcription factor n=1 Tax=candidate division CSSED10-310 bacterium TaxID=2855610 RepID=A0ABV6YR76_UNCC1